MSIYTKSTLDLSSHVAAPSKKEPRTLLNLPLNPKKLIASCLTPKELLTAGRVCKALNCDLGIEVIWRRLLQRNFPPDGLTRGEFLQLHQNMQTGQFKTQSFDLGPHIHRVSMAHLTDCSNSHIGTSAKDENDWSVYDQFGNFVCKPNIAAAKMQCSFCKTSYLMQDTLLLRYTIFPKYYCALFSRKNGSFLGKWPSPLPNEEVSLEALYPESRQMVLCNKWHTTVCVTDFESKVLAPYTYTEDQLPYFSKETRSIFYLAGNKLCEQPLLGESLAMVKISSSCSPKRFMANDKIISMVAESGKIHILDYKTGKSLSAIPKPDPQSGKLFREASLVGDKLKAVYDLKEGGVESTLYDKQGNKVIHVPKDKLPAQIFSVLGDHLLCHFDFSYHLYSNRGVLLKKYDHPRHAEPYAKSLNGTQFALCGNKEVHIFDYLPPVPDESKKS